jgi:DNA transformation protein and related proteins
MCGAKRRSNPGFGAHYPDCVAPLAMMGTPSKAMVRRDEEPQFIRYLRDQLARWAPVEVRRMFGGHGIFRSGTMFALIHAETLYLRSDAQSQALFDAAGLEPFRYRRHDRDVALGYHQAPPEALEDPDALAQWAERAYAAALRRTPRVKPAPRKARKAKSKRGRRHP